MSLREPWSRTGLGLTSTAAGRADPYAVPCWAATPAGELRMSQTAIRCDADDGPLAVLSGARDGSPAASRATAARARRHHAARSDTGRSRERSAPRCDLVGRAARDRRAGLHARALRRGGRPRVRLSFTSVAGEAIAIRPSQPTWAARRPLRVQFGAAADGQRITTRIGGPRRRDPAPASTRGW